LTSEACGGRNKSVKFWAFIDRVWLSLGSVKLTFVIFFGLLLLSIPGTIFLQENISNVDPALQYDYEFWQFGQWIQLFRSYHSFWYVSLFVILSVNLIVCSYERWPQMWKLAFARPVALKDEALSLKAKEHRFSAQLSTSQFENIKKDFEKWASQKWINFKILEDSNDRWQVFWQKNQLARLANYLVHTSLLLIFAGAIWSGLYGFEGTLNIPEGAAVDTFLMFKEGSDAGLERPPGNQGLLNERMMDYRVEASTFNVEFYKDFPGRPKEFATHLNVIDRGTGQIVSSKTIRVNEPLEVGKYTYYQASYGSLGDYRLDMRVIRKSSLVADGANSTFSDQKYISTKLGQVQKLDQFKTAFVPVKFVEDIEGRGPALQVQEARGETLVGEPFWVLKNDPVYDFGRDKEWAIVLDSYKPLYFTGLQLSYDPGAPVYWLGCLGMVLGTFYALFFQHKKFYFIVQKTNSQKLEINFTGTTHRLPHSFEAELKKLSEQISAQVIGKKMKEGES
jgi:cytochrome c biogenesis protein